MGACASFPQGMKGGAPAGPRPEPEKEEDIAAAATSDVAEDKAAIREVAMEGEEEKVAEEDVADKIQPLGSLINEASETQTAPPDTINPSPESEGKAEAVAASSSEAKESKRTDKASDTQTAPMETVKAEAAVAITYPDDGEKAPAEYVSPVASIAGDEKVAEDQ